MTQAQTTAQAKRVLLIRPSALGDVARTVPALVTLRQALPDAHIDWLVQDNYADVIRHHPALNGIVLFPRRRFGGWYRPAVMAEIFRWAKGLRQSKYDLVIDLQGLFRSGLFTWLTRAPRRVGLANAREGGAFAYNRKHVIDPNLHTVDRMLALLQAEGFEPVRDLRLYLSPADTEWREQYLREHVGVNEPYFTLAPTARWLCKCWPIERYTELALRLLDAKRFGARAVILVGPGEMAQVQTLIDVLGQRAVVPQTTVGQMMALLSRTSLHVGNDSAPLHIAVGFDRPLIGIFGPTGPRLVGPYRRENAVVQPPHPQPDQLRNYRRHRNDQSLISQISLEAVWQAIERQPPS